MSAWDVLTRYAEKQGWNETSMLDIACEYIDNQQAENAFEDYVSQRADAENESNDE